MLKRSNKMMLAAGLVTGAVMLTGPSFAAYKDHMPGHNMPGKATNLRQTISQEVQELSSKLNLTDSQKLQFKSIMDGAHKKKKDIFEQAGLNIDKIREQGGIPQAQRKGLMKRLSSVDKETRQSVKSLLNDNQLKQFDSWQKSMRKARGYQMKADKGGFAGWGN